MTEPRINWSELREALAIADGIPECRFDLNRVHSLMFEYVPQGKVMTDCGSAGCVIGWLACHPRYQNKIRLAASKHGGVHLNLKVRGRWTNQSHNFASVAAALFGLNHHEAVTLFGPVRADEIEAITGAPYRIGGRHHVGSRYSRQILRRRVIKFFEQYHQPVSDAYIQSAQQP